MLNFQCIIEYDGTDFSGWGKQPGHRTVQNEIEKALCGILQVPVSIICAGRTDKGVHASGQSVSFKTDTKISPEKLLLRLNSLLPQDICVKSAKAVPENFDARKSAKYKTYTYLIFNSPLRSPLYEKRSWHIAKPLDIKKMAYAAQFLQEKRDYSFFDSYNSVFGYKIVDLKKVKITKKGSFIAITITGDRFLYKMVRKMVGEMVKIGINEQNIKELKASVLSKNRRKTTKPALSHGLYLTKVVY